MWYSLNTAPRGSCNGTSTAGEREANRLPIQETRAQSLREEGISEVMVKIHRNRAGEKQGAAGRALFANLLSIVQELDIRMAVT
ncbi:hypothetical protein [Paraburkholderia unamae]|uniref:hypothetical protein n=1 Tax=Paraburkholderia unamae TaxID=219649 RepID=UPI0011BFB12E|nr:hypothetical protein [Paraburkholderia unamae]